MSSAGKASKSASKFSVTDLDNVRSTKKKLPASPTASIPKAPSKGRGGKKRKASEAEDLQGLPLSATNSLSTSTINLLRWGMLRSRTGRLLTSNKLHCSRILRLLTSKKTSKVPKMRRPRC
ncbi:uncharacterized protein LOC118481306 [Helianthus annuus]|uniref:uncharacterized protein LOC118481306 n=1 Tax=Helianthus annuus TaxID=4232 RepID=UPI001652F302|nr:uncharacterized protein LOC118481306 [Helianthus annuus]